MLSVLTLSLLLSLSGGSHATQPTLVQTAQYVSPDDEEYCDSYYRFGAAGRLNCALNSRLEHRHVPGFDNRSVFTPDYRYAY